MVSDDSPKARLYAAKIAKAESGDVDEALMLLVNAAGYLERKDDLPPPLADYLAVCFRKIELAATAPALRETFRGEIPVASARAVKAWFARYFQAPDFLSVAKATAAALNLRPRTRAKRWMDSAEQLQAHVGAALEMERKARRLLPNKRSRGTACEAVAERFGLTARHVQRLHTAWRRGLQQ